MDPYNDQFQKFGSPPPAPQSNWDKFKTIMSDAVGYLAPPPPKFETVKNAAVGIGKALLPPDPYEEAGKMVQQVRQGDYLGAAETGWGSLPMQGVFAGKLAKTADLKALQRAQDMEAAGANRSDILKDTKWFRGSDKQWRFEIPDTDAAYSTAGSHRYQDAGVYGVNRRSIAQDQGKDWVAEGFSGKAPDFMDHPALYEAYPHLRGLNWVAEGDKVRLGNPKSNYGGFYDHDNNRVVLSPQASRMISEGRSVGLHELQHAIQAHEGFAYGTNIEHEAGKWDFEAIKDAKMLNTLMGKERKLPTEAATEFETILGRKPSPRAMGYAFDPRLKKLPANAEDAYLRSAGEVEARNVQSRASLPEHTLGVSPPWSTSSVLDEHQLVSTFPATGASSQPIMTSVRRR